MEEKVILATVGIIIVVLNKCIAKGLIAWEVGIMGYSEPLHPWIYRAVSLLVGMAFLSITIIKE